MAIIESNYDNPVYSANTLKVRTTLVDEIFEKVEKVVKAYRLRDMKAYAKTDGKRRGKKDSKRQRGEKE